MKKKNYAIIGIVILAFILLIFTIGFSEGMEISIIVIIGLLSLLTTWIGFRDGIWKLAGIGALGVAITFGLMIWSSSNSSSRKEKEDNRKMEINKAKWAEQAKQDSIRHIQDSIQNYKDSLQMIEDSKRLYAQEGDSIFGDFIFGMSEKQCLAVQTQIQKETNGRISIAGHDFRIAECRYHNNKLYSITLKSANTWVRYYFHDAHEYDDSEGLGNGNDIVERIKERLSKKYGNPNKSGNWHFTYKDINGGSYIWMSYSDDSLSN